MQVATVLLLISVCLVEAGGRNAHNPFSNYVFYKGISRFSSQINLEKILPHKLLLLEISNRISTFPEEVSSKNVITPRHRHDIGDFNAIAIDYANQLVYAGAKYYFFIDKILY